jgi:gamma-glutamylcyclotransferase (GGCT)/AIG2-like uncharacterized protein YtfP
MLYFSYGTNMDPVGMRERAPGAKSLGPARLGGWRLTFTADAPDTGFGVPHIQPDENDEVWGVLWDVAEEDVNALDEYEGIAAGAYVRHTIAVSRGDDVVEALTYLAQAHLYRSPSKEFVEQIVRGAESHGLPPMYVQRLRRLG